MLSTDSSIADIAKNNGVYVSTLAKYVRRRLNIQTVNDVSFWFKTYDTIDARKIISPRDKTTKHVWNDILSRTSFLPVGSSIRERMHYIITNTTTPPLCGCGNTLSWSNTLQRFHNFCGDPRCEHAIHSANIKRIDTNLTNLGVEHAYLNPEVKAKRDTTMMSRYGGTSYNKAAIPEKSVATLTDKVALTQLYDKHKSTFRVADTLGVSQSHVSACMDKLGIIATNNTSGFETEIKEYITNTLQIDCCKTRSIISPKEIDVYIPSHKLAIECNGIYWHSEKYKEPNYHLNKTKECAANGVRLIHIFEDEYVNTPNIVKSRISSALGKNIKIGARKCDIRPVTFKDGNEFFNRTHIQGGCKTMSVLLGLFHNNTMVACMSFSKARYSKSVDFELVRYSSELYTNVVGGASKLFRAFITMYPKSPIVSYSDNRWNTGAVYAQLGFVFSHTSKPNYFYFKNGYIDNLMSRVKFQKHKLATTISDFDSAKSEYANMKANNYERIWDCGNTVWVYTPNLTHLQK